MYYKLNRDIGIRSWQNLPEAFFNRRERDAWSLSKKAFSTLCLCDGEHDIEPDRVLALLVLQGLITPCDKGDSIDDWQRLRVLDNPCYPAVNWAVTQRCNYRCRHCFMAAESPRRREEFSFDQCLSMIDELERCGIWRVSMTGGEPLIHPRFLDIVREVSARGMDLFEIATNGKLLDEHTLMTFKELGQKPLMKISFDGLGHHDWMRGTSGAEQAALDAISLCVEHDFPVRAQINIHRGNAHSILETLELFDSMGVAQARVIRTSEAPRWLDKGGDMGLSVDEYYDLMCVLAAAYIAKPHRMRLTLWQFLELDPVAKAYHNRPVKFCRNVNDDSLPACTMNRLMVSVTGAGEIVPCNQMEGILSRTNLSFGNVHRDGLQQALKSDRYPGAATIGETRKDDPKCGACPHWTLCAGGCPAISLGRLGRMTAHDPSMCSYFENGYLQRVRRIFDNAGGWICADSIEDK